MSELEEFDDTENDEDEWETPWKDFMFLIGYHSLDPKLDVCADEINKKCADHFSKEQDGLMKLWKKDVWCNPPHSLTKMFVWKAQRMWDMFNINILMLVPANEIGELYFDDIFDGK